jgi:hypothetical protein
MSTSRGNPTHLKRKGRTSRPRNGPNWSRMIQSFDRRSAGRVTDRQDDLRSASIPDCAQWAREYFDQYPNTNVEVIVLYQAALAVDTAKDTTQLTHHFVPVFGPKFAAWRDGGASPRRFSINSLVGKIEMNPTRLIMTNGATTMPMPAGYMFQRSEIYRYYDPQKGPHNAVISNPAPGCSSTRCSDRDPYDC